MRYLGFGIKLVDLKKAELEKDRKNPSVIPCAHPWMLRIKIKLCFAHMRTGLVTYLAYAATTQTDWQDFVSFSQLHSPYE